MSDRILLGCYHSVTVKRMEQAIAMDPELELIGSCSDGEEVYNEIIKKTPDIVVLQATMPGMDSLRLIELVRNDLEYDGVKFLLLGARGQKRLLQYMKHTENVCFIHYENPDEAIMRAIHQMMKVRMPGSTGAMSKTFPDVESSEELQKKATQMLQSLGIPVHIKGYMYLRSAIVMAAENMELLNALSKRLYPGVALMHHTTPGRVERSIRHAVELAWEHDPEGTRPTNSEFIANLADKLRLAR